METVKICRIRCKLCGDVLEYTNRSDSDMGPGRVMLCGCGLVGLDPSSVNYRVLAVPPATLEDVEDLSE